MNGSGSGSRTELEVDTEANLSEAADAADANDISSGRWEAQGGGYMSGAQFTIPPLMLCLRPLFFVLSLIRLCYIFSDCLDLI